MRPAGAIVQARDAFSVEAGDPPVRALARHPQFLGYVSDWPALNTDTVDQQPTAVHGQPGVTVGHEDLQALVKSANSTPPGGPPDINYLDGVSPRS
jgi:hypothetical protein